MGDPIPARSTHGQTLRAKFELEKRRLSYADRHYEDVKARLNMTHVENKETEKDEIIRHMSKLPNFLDPAKATPDRVLNFGVMDWGKLEKWKNQNQYLKCSSASSSNSSPLFSVDRSTPWSTGSQTCYPTSQKPLRVTLQSHFNTSSCFRNVEKFRDFNKNERKVSRFDTGNYEKISPSLKGKMKIEDEAVIEDRTRDFPTIFHGFSEINTRNTILEQKRSSFGSIKTEIKPRNMSPIRRFSFSTKRTESPDPRKSTVDNTCVKYRSQSSPFKRLLQPLFPPKTTNSQQPIEKTQNDDTTTTQAMFQTAVKNGRLLFMFAVENDNNNVFAATVRDLTSDNDNRWIYSFFMVDEIKKKNGNWLVSRNKKDKSNNSSYVPNMTAQMAVTDGGDNREFSLYHVDPTRVDELAGIVVKFVPRSVEDSGFSMTVILPGGNHGVSSNEKPSPLIERWRSGGGCDCGGWDLGCRLRTLTNRVKCNRRLNLSNGKFELYFQGDMTNERCYFSLSSLKEGIFSVKYNSSISALQAFSICISVLECRKSSQQTETRSYVAKQVHEDQNPVRFVPFPPLSPVGRV